MGCPDADPSLYPIYSIPSQATSSVTAYIGSDYIVSLGCCDGLSRTLRLVRVCLKVGLMQVGSGETACLLALRWSGMEADMVVGEEG